MDRRIESARYDDQLWVELFYDGKEKSVASVFVLCITEVSSSVILSVDFINHIASFPGHVDVETSSFSFANITTLLLNFVWVECLVVVSMQ